MGAGSRAQMYLDAIAGPHKDVAGLVAWSDTNPGRLDWSGARYPSRADIAAAARFDVGGLANAIAEHNVARVIITSPDYTHAAYIVTALEAGADVAVEKPLTINEEGVRNIADAATRSGGDVTITFNYRYSPRNEALKKVIADGDIGDVTSVHFEWVLDTAHGADYFRRWHRYKDHSGGLLIHKASHHFDLVNWWLDDVPTKVYASGGLKFYGAENAKKRGMGPRPERGSADSPYRDAFCLDLRKDEELKGLYFDQEKYDGYLRDRDVFDDGITIEDNMSLVVDYARGATMSYSLNAHSPWEGYTVYVNGSKGRAELTVVERGAVMVREDGTVTVDPSMHPDGIVSERIRPIGEHLMVQQHFHPAVEVPIPEGKGGHGGGDAQLLRDVFVGGDPDPLGRAAGWQDGVRSMAVGLAANRSLSTGQAVCIADLDLGGAAAALQGRDH